MCKYTVMTYDSDFGEFTPQPGVPSGPYTKWQLRRALRCLRELGYEARRGDPSVRVARVDCQPIDGERGAGVRK